MNAPEHNQTVNTEGDPENMTQPTGAYQTERNFTETVRPLSKPIRPWYFRAGIITAEILGVFGLTVIAYRAGVKAGMRRADDMLTNAANETAETISNAAMTAANAVAPQGRARAGAGT